MQMHPMHNPILAAQLVALCSRRTTWDPVFAMHAMVMREAIAAAISSEIGVKDTDMANNLCKAGVVTLLVSTLLGILASQGNPLFFLVVELCGISIFFLLTWGACLMIHGKIHGALKSYDEANPSVFVLLREIARLRPPFDDDPPDDQKKT